jgi:hypothetical protein
MQLKPNLSPSATRAQRWVPPTPLVVSLDKTPLTTNECSARQRSPFDLLLSRRRKPVRISVPHITARPIARRQKYLRMLQSGDKFPLLTLQAVV